MPAFMEAHMYMSYSDFESALELKEITGSLSPLFAGRYQ